MPSKSKAQHNLMALVANNPKAAKRLGIPKSVGEDYMKADKGKKFKVYLHLWIYNHSKRFKDCYIRPS